MHAPTTMHGRNHVLPLDVDDVLHLCGHTINAYDRYLAVLSHLLKDATGGAMRRGGGTLKRPAGISDACRAAEITISGPQPTSTRSAPLRRLFSDADFERAKKKMFQNFSDLSSTQWSHSDWTGVREPRIDVP